MAVPGILQKQGPEARIKEVLEDPRSFATTLITVVIDQYGTEALEWAPRTFQLEFLDDLQQLFEQANLRILAHRPFDPNTLLFPHEYFLGQWRR